VSGRPHPGVQLNVDGTLADSNYLHSLARSRAFRDACEWVPIDTSHRLIGMGGDQLVPDLPGHDSPEATAARPRRNKEPIAVGDNVWNAEAVRAAEIGFVAVETSGFSRHELNEAGALHVYRYVRERFRQLRTIAIPLNEPAAGFARIAMTA
jgi:phosphoglycolate phosphatase-like HAD superfamily hydrolase